MVSGTSDNAASSGPPRELLHILSHPNLPDLLGQIAEARKTRTVGAQELERSFADHDIALPMGAAREADGEIFCITINDWAYCCTIRSPIVID